MGDGSDGGKRLADLDARIRAARAARDGKRGDAGDEYKAGSLAWRMVTELVVGVLVGGAMGWGLDSLFGTLPLFLLVMGMFGFAAGVLTMMRSADEIREKERRDGGDTTSGADGQAGNGDGSGKVR